VKQKRIGILTWRVTGAKIHSFILHDITNNTITVNYYFGRTTPSFNFFEIPGCCLKEVLNRSLRDSHPIVPCVTNNQNFLLLLCFGQNMNNYSVSNEIIRDLNNWKQSAIFCLLINEHSYLVVLLTEGTLRNAFKILK